MRTADVVKRLSMPARFEPESTKSSPALGGEQWQEPEAVPETKAASDVTGRRGVLRPLIDLLDARLLTSEGQWPPGAQRRSSGLALRLVRPRNTHELRADYAIEALDIASRIQADLDPSSP